MSGTIENIAKKCLIEPGYTKVFKHTADVIRDYLCYLLTSVGAIALSFRFLSALGSGDVVCIISGQDIIILIPGTQGIAATGMACFG